MRYPQAHARLRPDERDDRRRAQGGARAYARLRRGRAAAGVGQGAGQLRLRRRPSLRGDDLSRAVQGPAGLRLPDGGARAGRGPRQDPPLDRRSRSTAPPTSCTASRSSASRSRSSGRARSCAALVYNPILDELYTAEKGQGAFLNNRRLRVAARKTLADCVDLHRHPPPRPARAPPLPRRVQGADGAGRRACAARARPPSISPGWPPAASTATSSAASEPWDMAAGVLLVREAGGFVTDADGGTAIASRPAASSPATRPCTGRCLPCWPRPRPCLPEGRRARGPASNRPQTRR